MHIWTSINIIIRCQIYEPTQPLQFYLPKKICKMLKFKIRIKKKCFHNLATWIKYSPYRSSIIISILWPFITRLPRKYLPIFKNNRLNWRCLNTETNRITFRKYLRLGCLFKRTNKQIETYRYQCNFKMKCIEIWCSYVFS